MGFCVCVWGLCLGFVPCQGREAGVELGLAPRMIGPAMTAQMDLLLVDPTWTRDAMLVELRRRLDAGELARE